MDTYCIIPESSAGSLPPYSPKVSSAGIPSICSSVTSPENEHGALPKIKTPPHKPRSSSSRLVPAVSPASILSLVEVNMMGCVGVPTALIFEPRAMIKAEARDPVPGEPLIIVPSCIVSVAPLSTTTF